MLAQRGETVSGLIERLRGYGCISKPRPEKPDNRGFTSISIRVL